MKTGLPLHVRIKELRKSRGWTQGELADKIDIEIKMISHYETKKSVPSIDSLVKMAELFNVSTDYLLIEHAPKRSFLREMDKDKELADKISEVMSLPEKDREVVVRVIDALVGNQRVKEVVGGME
ncbi:MAG: helix-turn-helix transcriptional regulator [bacterium]|nr:helix-turn-helix transcriptional regulator [bacterium]